MRARGGLGRAAIGLLVSAIAIALVLRDVDVAGTWTVLRGADVRWVVVLVAFSAADVLLRAVRWRVLLAPIAAVPVRTTLASLLVGYLANNVLPARLGELVRSHDLGVRAGISRPTVLGSIVVERLVDTAVLIAIAAVAILVLAVRGVVVSALLVGLAVVGLLILGVAVAVAAHRVPGASRVVAAIGRWPSVEAILRRLRDGLAIAGRPRTMGGAVVLTAAAWGCTILAFTAGARAVGLEPSLGQAALLAAGTVLATAIPSAPGYVGTFELAAVTIGGSVGIAAEPALAFAVLVHATTLALTSLAGASVLVIGGRGAAAAPEVGLA